jgi:hypothetical protein
LANIYLDKLDKYIKEYTNQFNKGKGIQRRKSSEIKRLEWKKYLLNKKLKSEKDKTVRKQLIEQIKAIIQERQQYPCSDCMDDRIKRLRYIRYADDFLIGIIGNKSDCTKIKEDIKNYLNNHLGLELSEEKTLITNAKKSAKFLGFNILTRKTNKTKRNIHGNPIRSLNGKIVLYLSTDVLRNKLLEYGAVKITTRNGKEVWESKARTRLKNNDELEILLQYNSEIRGLYNYYCIANNSSIINSFYNIMEYSLYKTFANKLKSSVRKVLRRYTHNKQFSISYKNEKGKVKYRSLYHDGFKRKKSANVKFGDDFPQTENIIKGINGLLTRLKAQSCERCGSNDEIEVHHVHKLKDLKGKQKWEKEMIARKRKTLVLCHTCHLKLHAGKLD